MKYRSKDRGHYKGKNLKRDSTSAKDLILEQGKYIRRYTLWYLTKTLIT